MYTHSDFALGSKLRCITHSSVNNTMQHEGTVVGVASGLALPAHAGASVFHTRIYPTLPEEVREVVADDELSYDYVILRADDGQLFYIGTPWISSIENISTLVRNVVIHGSDEIADDRIIKDLLLMGYKASIVA